MNGMERHRPAEVELQAAMTSKGIFAYAGLPFRPRVPNVSLLLWHHRHHHHHHLRPLLVLLTNPILNLSLISLRHSRMFLLSGGCSLTVTHCVISRHDFFEFSS
ncbi:hypothetical protein M752DRAFT_133552 [Aspergillus phoenicis ATCC 13157]|uniref:Uncharacterized protein n=1 Tax=Aspergillus phoenicis ATCC 13157 TaxID=1353007 RepID=A0A370PSJ0_ASPPH|nr:hypothetical protein M752DRAFT_133552 [Aspergillus phoenicis ATCC 13157]